MYWDIIKEQNDRTRHPRCSKKVTQAESKRSARPKHSDSISRKRAANEQHSTAKSFFTKRKVIFASMALVLIFGIILVASTYAPAAEMPFESENVTAPIIRTRPIAENADELQFSQSGEYWKILGYWDDNVSYSGCGLCSYTSAIDIVTGRSYTPTDMLVLRGDWAGMDNYTDDGTGLDAGTHGEFTYKEFSVASGRIDTTSAALENALSENCVAVICTGGDVFLDIYGNVYDYPGHFVCAYRYDEASDTFFVHDSAIEHSLGTAVQYSRTEMDYMMEHASSTVAYRYI